LQWGVDQSQVENSTYHQIASWGGDHLPMVAGQEEMKKSVADQILKSKKIDLKSVNSGSRMEPLIALLFASLYMTMMNCHMTAFHTIDLLRFAVDD
jgi:dihydroxyacetone kinase